MGEQGPGGPSFPTEPGRDDFGITFGAPSGPPPMDPGPIDYTTGPAPFISGPDTNRLRSHGEGTTILVLGIVSVVFCPLVGPLAWSMGNKAMADVRFSGYVFRNAGFIRAGRLLGAVASIAMLLIGLAFILTFCSAVNRGSQSTPTGAYAPALEVRLPGAILDAAGIGGPDGPPAGR